MAGLFALGLNRGPAHFFEEPFMLKFILVFGLIFSAVPTLAEESEDTKLTLQVTAIQRVMQDRLAVALSAREQGASAEAVQEALNARMADALEVVESVDGIEEKTQHYRVYFREEKRYSSSTSDSGKRKGYWVASQQLYLTSANFDALKALSTQLQQSGLALSHMNFFVSSELNAATRDALIPQAVETLKDKVRLYKAAMGGGVARLATINVQGRHEGRMASKTMMSAPMMEMDARGSSPAPIVAEPEEVDVSLSLSGTIVFDAVSFD
jgi:predicted secreted protein